MPEALVDLFGLGLESGTNDFHPRSSPCKYLAARKPQTRVGGTLANQLIEPSAAQAVNNATYAAPENGTGTHNTRLSAGIKCRAMKQGAIKVL
jgi:hypothetical protein